MPTFAVAPRSGRSGDQPHSFFSAMIVLECLENTRGMWKDKFLILIVSIEPYDSIII